MHASRRVFAFPALIVLSFFAFLMAARTQAATPGSLVKASTPTVYYYGADGKRYVFPNDKVFFSWYADFSSVTKLSDAELAAIPLGGNVTYKPGSRMVKITSDPKVYAVDANGTLRWVKTEAAAIALYGADWNAKIDDIPDAFFVNYRFGTDIAAATDFSPTAVKSAAVSIGADRGLAASASSGIDVTKLPLGDKKVSTSAKKGYIYSCQTSFTGGGAFTQGPWIHGDTWDLTQKATVDGSVSWPNASVTIARSGSNRVITSNALPKGHATGKYPIASTDDAYLYDRNPNSISAQSLSVTLPADPTPAAAPSCLGGEVGISVSGVPIFNGFDAGGRDAVAMEVQDACDGHPQEAGQYHYHGASDCVATGDSELFGYAYDGFGIYSNLESGRSLTNDDLDECHGHTHEISWDGAGKSMYHYHLTKEFPYTLGCYRGTSAWKGPSSGGQTQGGGQMPPPGGMMPPPPR